MNLVINVGPAPTPNVWTTFSAVLSETGGWRKYVATGGYVVPTAAEFQEVLADLDRLYIRGDYGFGTINVEGGSRQCQLRRGARAGPITRLRRPRVPCGHLLGKTTGRLIGPVLTGGQPGGASRAAVRALPAARHAAARAVPRLPGPLPTEAPRTHRQPGTLARRAGAPRAAGHGGGDSRCHGPTSV